MEILTKTAQRQHRIHNFRRKKKLLSHLFRSYSVLSSSKNETKAEGSFHWYKSTYSWEIDGETVETVADFGSKITADGDCSHEIKRCLLLGRKVRANLDSILKSRDITLSTKVRLVKAIFFSSSHVWMWELDHKESWAPKNWWFWTVVLEKTLESSLDCKEIQPVHPKGDQSWMFIGKTDV